MVFWRLVSEKTEKTREDGVQGRKVSSSLLRKGGRFSLQLKEAYIEIKEGRIEGHNEGNA